MHAYNIYGMVWEREHFIYLCENTSKWLWESFLVRANVSLHFLTIAHAILKK